MGCIVRLTAIVALATGLHVNLLSEASAHSRSGLPDSFSGTELIEKNLNAPPPEGGMPETGGGTGGRVRAPHATERGGLPDADRDTGSR